MEWVASTLHTTSEHGVSSITTADAHTSAASSRLNGRPRRFKWTRPLRRKTKSGFCACTITFKLASTYTVRGQCLLCGTLDGKQQSVKVWSSSRTVDVHSYFHQCIISLLVEFERLTCGRTKEFVLVLRICSAVRVYGMCVVQITKTVITRVMRLIFLSKNEVRTTKLGEKSPLAKYLSVTANLIERGIVSRNFVSFPWILGPVFWS